MRPIASRPSVTEEPGREALNAHRARAERSRPANPRSRRTRTEVYSCAGVARAGGRSAAFRKNQDDVSMDSASRQADAAQSEVRSVGTLLSVNVGLPKNVSWQGNAVFTGVFKEPVGGPRRVGRLNVDGDGQGDLAGHGGEQRAVFVYQIESYRHWEQELERDDFVYGQFGENFTVEGLRDDEVCIGDRYRIGAAF